MNNKKILSTLVAIAVSSLTACGGGSSDSGEKSADEGAPVITLNDASVVMIREGTIYNDAGASATDDVDGEVEVVTSGLVNSTRAGTYSLTYTATDLAGNKATKTRTVKVQRPVDFSVYDGDWKTACHAVTEENNKVLFDFGIKSMWTSLSINKQYVSAHGKGFVTSDCSGGVEASRFDAWGNGSANYMGEVITSTCPSGEKIDIKFLDGKINRIDGLTDQALLKGMANQIGLAYYDILCISSKGRLMVGDISSKKGVSENTRPDEFVSDNDYILIP